MDTKTVIVLDPTAKSSVKKVSTAPLDRKLDKNLSIGFLWNGKPNGDILLKNIEDRISKKYQLAGTCWYKKASVAVAADAAMIDELAANSNLVITAIAD